ncbi:DUF6771 family protein [Sphingomonas sp. Leaf21]|uniref:DUF6771 family protein n=1 Tax=Sphingomonas sp. Leaf21 TaxID=2876550 RepID=UPI002E75E980|nr:DUF6771 family protein [Sphingomonas sp. Leaf21]
MSPSAGTDPYDPDIIAEAILSSSGFARVGITMPDVRLRERAARDMAQTIAARLDQPPPHDSRQIVLPL